MMNGDVYEGEWLNDKAYGKGSKRFAAGYCHEGGYYADLRHGYGVYRWASGDKLEGFWSFGDQVARGSYWYSNGDVFVGFWVKGLKEGRGIFTTGNTSFEEVWVGGKRQSRAPTRYWPRRLLHTTPEHSICTSTSPFGPIRAGVIGIEAPLDGAAGAQGQDGQGAQGDGASDSARSLAAAASAAAAAGNGAAGAAAGAGAADMAVSPRPEEQLMLEVGAAAGGSTSVVHSGRGQSDFAALAAIDASSARGPRPELRSPRGGGAPSIGPVLTPSTSRSRSTMSDNGVGSSASAVPAPAPVAAAGPAMDDNAEQASAGPLSARPSMPGLNQTGACMSPGPAMQDASMTCKICYSAAINTVFLRCGHMVSCMPCSDRIDKCPICRAPIQDVIQTFRA